MPKKSQCSHLTNVKYVKGNQPEGRVIGYKWDKGKDSNADAERIMHLRTVDAERLKTPNTAKQ